MSISQIESELITLITVEAYLERSLKSILSKKEKDQLKQTCMGIELKSKRNENEY